MIGIEQGSDGFESFSSGQSEGKLSPKWADFAWNCRGFQQGEEEAESKEQGAEPWEQGDGRGWLFRRNSVPRAWGR